MKSALVLLVLCVIQGCVVYAGPQPAPPKGEIIEVKSGDETYDEEVVLDEDKEQEILYVRSKDGRIHHVVVEDYRRGIEGMYLSDINECLLVGGLDGSDSPFAKGKDENRLREKLERLPEETKEAVEKALSSESDNETEAKPLKKVNSDPIEDRSILPEPLAEVCANTDVYWAERVSDEEGHRTKRGCYGYRYCYRVRYCYWGWCWYYTRCRYVIRCL